MTSLAVSRLIRAAAVSLVATLGLASQPVAADSLDDFSAGQACKGFDLRVEVIGTSRDTVVKDFYDKKGNLVRVRTVNRGGPGAELVLTNLNTGANLSFGPKGAVFHDSLNPDGSVTSANTGTVFLIWFPTDVPAGPTANLYVGRVVYTIDTSGVGTLQSVAGKTTDICAALGG